MEINFDKMNRTLIVHINGEIDHHTSEEIKNKTEKEFGRINGKNILFDFSGVRFMDSSGIGMVIGRYKFIKALSGFVAVVNVSEPIHRIFSISGLYKIIPDYDTIQQALEEMEGDGRHAV